MLVLAKPDVMVTNHNQSDKTMQIERLKVFAANVRKLNTDLAGSDGLKLVFHISKAVGPKPTSRTWERGREDRGCRKMGGARLQDQEAPHHSEHHFLVRGTFGTQAWRSSRECLTAQP